MVLGYGMAVLPSLVEAQLNYRFSHACHNELAANQPHKHNRTDIRIYKSCDYILGSFL